MFYHRVICYIFACYSSSTPPPVTLPISTKTTTAPIPIGKRNCECSPPMVGINIESSDGDEVAVMNISDYSQCCTACQQHSLCSAFTILRRKRKCYLKRSANRYGNASDAVSGRIVCTGGCRCGHRMNNKTIQTGRNVAVIDTRDFYVCCDACRAHPRCNAFTVWEFTVNKCYLKARTEPVASGSNVISSVVDCEDTGCRCSVPRTGVNIETNDGSNLAVLENTATYDQCCTACQQNTLCHAFTIWQSRCYLKASADRFGRANNVVSGEKICS